MTYVRLVSHLCAGLCVGLLGWRLPWCRACGSLGYTRGHKLGRAAATIEHAARTAPTILGLEDNQTVKNTLKKPNNNCFCLKFFTFCNCVTCYVVFVFIWAILSWYP